jgi:hypothetical protein
VGMLLRAEGDVLLRQFQLQDLKRVETGSSLLYFSKNVGLLTKMGCPFCRS